MWAQRRAVFLVFSAVGAGCGGDPGPVDPPPPQPGASIEIAPLAGPIESFGASFILAVTVRDVSGNMVSSPTVSWTSREPPIVTVTESGRITAVANGTARIVATSSDLADTLSVTVAQQVASVQVQPSLPTLELPGDTVRVSGQAVDARGNPVADAGPVNWTVANVDVARIDTDGLIEAAGFGATALEAAVDGTTFSTQIEVIGDRFYLSNGTRIRYDVEFPDGSGGPFPAMIFVHGSGQVTRFSNRAEIDPFVREGLAVLRYDKRGVGESGGTFQNIGPTNSVSALGELADDIANAARFMARLSEIDATRIGLLGASQGGWIVPQAAVRERDLISYVMLWSGPTISVGLENFYSSLADGTNTPLDDVYAQLDGFSGTPGYDALADITSLSIPGIWQYGELDRSIPMRLDVVRLEALIAQGKPFEVQTWEFGGHDLRDTRTNTFYPLWDVYYDFLRRNGILPPLGS